MQKKRPYTARFTAAETLCELQQLQSSVKIIFEATVKKHNLPQKERNLTMSLIYGVLRQQQYLDRIIQELSKTPIRKLHPFVHQALAVALFQIFFLERIPDSAAVNEAVNSCKAKGVPKRLHGFVNGILREALRQKKDKNLAEIGLTEKSGEPVYNHPKWLVERWIDNFGEEETARICHQNSKEPQLILRVNTSLISTSDFCNQLEANTIAHHPGDYAPNSIVLPDFHGSIQSIPGYNRGHFQVQDQAAQLATSLLGPFTPGGKYLDGCAGLGGKTSHLLQLGTAHNIEVQAVEPEQRRLTKLLENQLRLFQDSKLAIFEGTLQKFATQCDTLFDGIIIDAPCSGTGVIGRHPDIRWNREEQDLQNYAKLQSELLHTSVQLLKPKGIIVYATCSLEPEENQRIVDDFLRNNQDFSLTNCAEQLPKPAHTLVQNRFFCPHPSDSIDGFFAARMQRTEEF